LKRSTVEKKNIGQSRTNIPLKTLLMGWGGGFFIYIKLGILSLNRDMAQGALVFHGTSVCTGRPFNG